MAGGAQLQARTLGCKAPEELSSAFPEWAGCNFIPENLHPKSFRGYIGHNTNVWAAANRAGIKVRSLYRTRSPSGAQCWLKQTGSMPLSSRPDSPLRKSTTCLCRCVVLLHLQSVFGSLDRGAYGLLLCMANPF